MVCICIMYNYMKQTSFLLTIIIKKWIALTKVLTKEVAPFNIRTLTVILGTLNTNMLNNVVLGKNTTPLPDDYNGTVTNQILQLLVSGKIKPNGDKDKAMKAVYEVVVGEGVGEGHETEKLLPLGSDMVARARGVQDYLGHALEVFGSVAGSVDVDG